MEVESALPEVTQMLEEVKKEDEKLEEVKLIVEDSLNVQEKSELKIKRGSFSKFFRKNKMKSSSYTDVTATTSKISKSRTLMSLFSKKEKSKDEGGDEAAINLNSLSITDVTINSVSKTKTLMRFFSRKEKPKEEAVDETGAEVAIDMNDLNSSSIENINADSVAEASTFMRMFSKKDKPKDEEEGVEPIDRRSFIMRGLTNCHVVPWVGRRPSMVNIHQQPLELVAVEKDYDEGDNAPQEIANHSEIF